MGERKTYNKGIFSLSTVLLIAISAVMLAGCDDPNIVTSPHYRYGVHVTGIEDFTAVNGTAHIMVPIPIYKEKPLIPFNGSVTQDLSFGPAWNWNKVTLNDWGFNVIRSLSVNTTQYGPMLEMTANETGYSVRRESASPSPSANMTALGYDNYQYNKTAPTFDEVRVHITNMFGSAEGNDTVRALIAKPLYPDAGNASTPYTMWIYGANESNRSYTSYVYIDPALTGPKNGSFALYAIFEVIVGDRPYGGPGKHTVYVIRESIPSNVTGFIPVKVQYMGVFNEYSPEDRWAPA